MANNVNGPTYGEATVFPNFDQGLGRAKKGLDWFREDYVLGTLGFTQLFKVASIGAGAANTTVQDYYPLPARAKISKIAVFCSAIDAVTGDAFNIVLGTASYTQGVVPGNDNSSVPPVAYNSGGQAAGNSNPTPTYAAGGGGIASNVAVKGNAFFSADVIFNTTNFPNLTTSTGTGTPYAQIFVPASPDAVWPNSGLLTLRVVTNASTGSISNLIVCGLIESYPLSATYPPANFPPYATPEPQTDF